jgi:uncharacterized protein (TIGR02594 family)
LVSCISLSKSGTKLAKPAYGCVAVKTRIGGGHVCFVVGKDKASGKLVCLGGNQSNMVCYALYNESDFEALCGMGRLQFQRNIVMICRF